MKHKHHIIPKHMNGSDDPCNIIELTIEEHADAHRILYEKHGYWQDLAAWQGLSKLTEKESLLKFIFSEAGKKGNALRSSTNLGKKYNMKHTVASGSRKGTKNPCARQYLVTMPDGSTLEVKSLKTWCESVGLKYNTFHTTCILRKGNHKGYRASRI